MWGIQDTPPPIEKIRKAQWSAENTAQTQAVVTELEAQRRHLRAVVGVSYSGNDTEAVRALTAAIERFRQLDPHITVALR